MWYVCDVLHAVLYVRVRCFVVRGWSVSRRYILMTSCGSNVHTNPNMEIISPSMNVLDLGIYMSGDCTFNCHISSLSKSVLICLGGF